MEIKKCSKCGEVKSLSVFYRRSLSKDGYDCICKICKNIALKKWQSKNHTKLKNIREKWLKNNPVKAKEVERKSREKHREKINAYHRKWSKNNPDKSRDRVKRWRDKNPDKSKAIGLKRVQNLTNSYVASSLNSNLKDCLLELIELKRVQLKLYRLTHQ